MASAWFQRQFRPSISNLQVILYENGKQKDISKFDDFRHGTLVKAVDAFLQVDESSPYWFETDIYEHRTCFKPVKISMEVICYTQDKYNPALKKPSNIPLRYRKKLFDKRHTIHPELFSNIIWPPSMEVQFIQPEK